VGNGCYDKLNVETQNFASLRNINIVDQLNLWNGLKPFPTGLIQCAVFISIQCGIFIKN
jgi:hypothetical protein